MRPGIDQVIDLVLVALVHHRGEEEAPENSRGQFSGHLAHFGKPNTLVFKMVRDTGFEPVKRNGTL